MKDLTDIAAHDATAPPRRPPAAAMVAGASVGNLVEWFDWYTYSALALYFAPAFFPSGNRTVQLMNAAAVFAVGFLMRPIGGWMLGAYADQRGRKAALTLSVLLMCFGSLIIALTPDYQAIGLAAPALLVFARLLQGLSVGGEYGASATYLTEIAPHARRGFYSSFQYVTLILGQLLSLGVLIALQFVFLTPEQLADWGWRIPFFIGAAALFVFMLLQPAFGALSDKIGRRPLLIGFGVFGTLLTYPIMSTLATAGTPIMAFVLIVAALLVVSGYTSINAVVKAELFPTEIRALGVALPYALTVSLFGGTAEFIALSLKQAGREEWFYWYVTGCILISLLVCLAMQDTRARDLKA